jgi:hypothetical protein
VFFFLSFELGGSSLAALPPPLAAPLTTVFIRVIGCFGDNVHVVQKYICPKLGAVPIPFGRSLTTYNSTVRN